MLRTTVSLYPADLELLGPDPQSRLTVLSARWHVASNEQRAKARAHARLLTRACRKGKIPCVRRHLVISDEVRFVIDQETNGSASAGVRLLLGLLREMPARESKSETQWKTLTIRTGVYERLLAHDTAKPFAEWLRLAIDTWHKFPDTMRETYSDAHYHVVNEGKVGQFNAKLHISEIETLEKIGSISFGTRVVLRGLADLLDGTLIEPEVPLWLRKARGE